MNKRDSLAGIGTNIIWRSLLGRTVLDYLRDTRATDCTLEETKFGQQT
jgi:hypothetical protein